MGNVSWQFKKFADASSKAWFTRAWKDKLGMSAGLMTATPSDASVDEMVPGDLATAKAFGERLASVTARLG